MSYDCEEHHYSSDTDPCPYHGEPPDSSKREADSSATNCSPTFFICGVFIRERFALMRERLKGEPFERQEFIGAWLDATEAEIFEENTV